MDRRIAITIDERRLSAESVEPATGLELDDENGIDVQLDANGGIISGTLEILSNTPNVDGFTIGLTPPPVSTTAIVEDPVDDHVGRASATTRKIPVTTSLSSRPRTPVITTTR